MDNYVLFTDSTADLPQKIIEEFDIHVVPMRLMIDNKSFYENELDSAEFYGMIKTSHKTITTTQVNPQEYADCFEKFLKDGKNVLYICFSSSLSGCYNSACIAAEELNSKYDFKVRVVDSLSASMGEGMLVYKLALKKKSGLGFEESISWAEENRLKICHLFTVDDLNHLSKSGRLSKTSAFFGSMLNIKPVLHVDNEGRLVGISKTRGRHKSIETMAEMVKKYSEGLSNDIIFISHGDCPDDAKELAEKVKEKTGITNIVFGDITPMIGTHTGLGTLAIFFEGNQR